MNPQLSNILNREDSKSASFSSSSSQSPISNSSKPSTPITTPPSGYTRSPSQDSKVLPSIDSFNPDRARLFTPLASPSIVAPQNDSPNQHRHSLQSVASSSLLYSSIPSPKPDVSAVSSTLENTCTSISAGVDNTTPTFSSRKTSPKSSTSFSNTGNITPQSSSSPSNSKSHLSGLSLLSESALNDKSLEENPRNSSDIVLDQPEQLESCSISSEPPTIPLDSHPDRQYQTQQQNNIFLPPPPPPPYQYPQPHTYGPPPPAPMGPMQSHLSQSHGYGTSGSLGSQQQSVQLKQQQQQQPMLQIPSGTSVPAPAATPVSGAPLQQPNSYYPNSFLKSRFDFYGNDEYLSSVVEIKNIASQVYALGNGITNKSSERKLDHSSERNEHYPVYPVSRETLDKMINMSQQQLDILQCWRVKFDTAYLEYCDFQKQQQQQQQQQQQRQQYSQGPPPPVSHFTHPHASSERAPPTPPSINSVQGNLHNASTSVPQSVEPITPVSATSDNSLGPPSDLYNAITPSQVTNNIQKPKDMPIGSIGPAPHIGAVPIPMGGAPVPITSGIMTSSIGVIQPVSSVSATQIINSAGQTVQRRGKRRANGNADKPYCHHCGASETPEWRRGPDGARTLCNACGLYHSKMKRKNRIEQERLIAASRKSQASTPSSSSVPSSNESSSSKEISAGSPPSSSSSSSSSVNFQVPPTNRSKNDTSGESTSKLSSSSSTSNLAALSAEYAEAARNRRRRRSRSRSVSSAPPSPPTHGMIVVNHPGPIATNNTASATAIISNTNIGNDSYTTQSPSQSESSNGAAEVSDVCAIPPSSANNSFGRLSPQQRQHIHQQRRLKLNPPIPEHGVPLISPPRTSRYSSYNHYHMLPPPQQQQLQLPALYPPSTATGRH